MYIIVQLVHIRERHSTPMLIRCPTRNFGLVIFYVSREMSRGLSMNDLRVLREVGKRSNECCTVRYAYLEPYTCSPDIMGG